MVQLGDSSSSLRHLCDTSLSQKHLHGMGQLGDSCSSLWHFVTPATAGDTYMTPTAARDTYVTPTAAGDTYVEWGT